MALSILRESHLDSLLAKAPRQTESYQVGHSWGLELPSQESRAKAELSLGEAGSSLHRWVECRSRPSTAPVQNPE